MAQLNKLALVRMALRYAIKELSRQEKLCILADIYCPRPDGVRWTGVGGYGTSGLDQGIYSHLTTHRRISDLWLKLEAVGAKAGEETRIIKDFILSELSPENIAEMSVREVGDDPLPEIDAKRPQQAASDPLQLKLVKEGI